jgi:sulfite exporter TauE/SafE
MKRDTASDSKWDLESLAYIGALLGLLPVGMHQIYSISIRDFHGGDPFTHMMVELVGGVLGGAVLLCAIGWFRNKQVTERRRKKQKAISKPEL